MEIITRKTALEQGLKYYFIGKACKNGHFSKRKTGCSTCYECSLIIGKRYNYNDTVKKRRANQSPEERARDNTNKAKYAKSPKGIESREKYKQTDKWKESRKKTLEKDKNRYLKRYYGIDIEDFEKMVDSQGGRCKICNTIPDKKLCVDHCHKTGTIRGLLCSKCNSGIGMLQDSPELLENALKYLKEYN